MFQPPEMGALRSEKASSPNVRSQTEFHRMHFDGFVVFDMESGNGFAIFFFGKVHTNTRI